MNSTTESKKYFVFDTYALIEISKKNKNYETYLSCEMITNIFIYAEYCYDLLKTEGKIDYERSEKIKETINTIAPSFIEEAMKFRYAHKKQKMSATDCISYIMAKKLGVPFLTGDKEFEGLPNVEFVK
jgi:predicted nucleic acid-binding protein